MYKVREINKIAGVRLPENEKQWPAEVLKSLKSQHPYIDEGNIKIQFTRLDTSEDTAGGRVIVDKKIVLPFSIRKDEKSKKMELDPIDIMYADGQFKALNENSLIESMDNQQVGRLEQKKDNVPSSNEYIGDQTGDVTPLEWSSYPAGFAGPRSTTAGSGLLSYVVKNEQDVNRLFNALNTYENINSAAEAMGLRDSLENLKTGLEIRPSNVLVAHITKRRGLGYAVAFDNGDTRAVSARDLKAFLGEDFGPICRQIKQKGYAVYRNMPRAITADVSRMEMLPATVKLGGTYMMMHPDGNREKFHVFSEIIHFDGTVDKTYKAVSPRTLAYTTGKAFQGIRMSDDCSLPIGVIEPGKKGFFVDENWGSNKASINIIIRQVVEMPDGLKVIVAQDEYTGRPIGLVPTPSILRPQEIPAYRRGEFPMLPEHSYYLPAHMSFVEVGDHIVLADKEARRHEKTAHLKKNAGRFHLYGNTKDGQVDIRNMSADQMRLKLASYRLEDRIIDEASLMKEGEEKSLYNLQSVAKKASKSKQNVIPRGLFRHLKTAAEDAIQAVNESEEASSDPQIVDAVLSLQVMSDEAIEDLVGSEQIFIECEDKLARLLIAARQGQNAINEKAVQKALKGIGEARKSLKALALEMEAN